MLFDDFTPALNGGNLRRWLAHANLNDRHAGRGCFFGYIINYES